jgi:hypothetical protein
MDGGFEELHGRVEEEETGVVVSDGVRNGRMEERTGGGTGSGTAESAKSPRRVPGRWRT